MATSGQALGVLSSLGWPEALPDKSMLNLTLKAHNRVAEASTESIAVPEMDASLSLADSDTPL